MQQRQLDRRAGRQQIMPAHPSVQHRQHTQLHRHPHRPHHVELQPPHQPRHRSGSCPIQLRRMPRRQRPPPAPNMHAAAIRPAQVEQQHPVPQHRRVRAPQQRHGPRDQQQPDLRRPKRSPATSQISPACRSPDSSPPDSSRNPTSIAIATRQCTSPEHASPPISATAPSTSTMWST